MRGGPGRCVGERLWAWTVDRLRIETRSTAGLAGSTYQISTRRGVATLKEVVSSPSLLVSIVREG